MRVFGRIIPPSRKCVRYLDLAHLAPFADNISQLLGAAVNKIFHSVQYSCRVKVQLIRVDLSKRWITPQSDEEISLGEWPLLGRVLKDFDATRAHQPDRSVQVR